MLIFHSTIRGVSRAATRREIYNLRSSAASFKDVDVSFSKRHYSDSSPGQPKILRSGKVLWQNRKGCRSFGLALDKSPVSNKSFPKAEEIFPGALTNTDLVNKIRSTLENAGYDVGKTLVATSLCCDEVNRPLELELANAFTNNFNMGGLAGFPFGGATSFGAMAAHIPDGGSCLVVYGPHVGVDSSGAVGTVERRGRVNGGSCCGSAVAASQYVSSVFAGEAVEASPPEDAFDAQQYYVGKMLLPFAERLEKSENKMVELPKALYEAQTEFMKKIVKHSAGSVADGKVAVLGGIQVNTPPGYAEYYVPMSFEMYNNQGELLEQFW